MKNIKYWLLNLIFLTALFSCTDEVGEVKQAGNPTLEVMSQFSNVHFGDELPFEVNVSDDVSLSTLAVKLFFGEEEVSKTIIRTKANGKYAGSISVPFLKDIPDGIATLEFVLLNTTMKSIKKEIELPVKRASYPYLLLVTENGTYPMTPTGNPYEYAATEAFPSTDIPAYIKTPVVDDKGNEIYFGWEAGKVAEGVTSFIPFVSPVGGKFSVVFNTKTYQAAPFFEILVNSHKMRMVDKQNYELDIELKQGEEVKIEGLENLADWWIDVDYFNQKEVGLYDFVPLTGKYRISANLTLNYFKIEVLDGNSLATLKPDGTGAIWIIGEHVGKPSVVINEVGWNTSKALCMAPIGNKRYQLTVVAGETVRVDRVNFNFFYQNDWGDSFKSDTFTTAGDLIFIGNVTNGVDNGNLAMYPDKTFEEGAAYVFIMDVSGGNENAVLTVTKK